MSYKPYTPAGSMGPYTSGQPQGYNQGYTSQSYSQNDTYNPYNRQQSLTPSPYSSNSSGYGDSYGSYQQQQQQQAPLSYPSTYSHQTSAYGGSSYPPPPATSSSTLFPPNSDSAILQIFQQADLDRNGTIDSNELHRLLSQGREAFTPRTVRLMVHLFAENPSDPSRIGRDGFVKLWKELGLWHEKFMEFDRDGSGTIDVEELRLVLRSKPFYFAIPDSVLDMLVKKYDHSEVGAGYGYGYGNKKKSIGYGQFVECGFIVKGLTEKFRDHDRAKDGNAAFDYTSFMLMVIPYIAA